MRFNVVELINVDVGVAVDLLQESHLLRHGGGSHRSDAPPVLVGTCQYRGPDVVPVPLSLRQ